MIYDYISSIILLGPSNAGKSSLINTFLNKQNNNMVTIGADFHKLQLKYINHFYQLKIWDTGKGFLYKNIINDFLKKSDIYIIINKHQDYKFINEVFENIYNPKLIIFIYNKTNNNDNFKYNEDMLKNINKNILMKFFYINITKKTEVNIIFSYIKTYIYNLLNNTAQTNIIEKNNISCCNIS